MAGRSPAQLFALVFGAVLVAAGILGFFVSADFGVGGQTDTNSTLLAFDVNGWHNIVHLISGAIGLAVVGSYTGARAYAFGLGAVYVVLTILGFTIAVDEVLLGFVPINTADNFLHLAIAIAAIGAGLATPAQPAPTTST
jgi:hypothetical protein